MKYAGMMELVDMRDLGSRAVMRWGSSPHARTNKKVTFVYQDKGGFFEWCLPAENDVGVANDDGFA